MARMCTENYMYFFKLWVGGSRTSTLVRMPKKQEIYEAFCGIYEILVTTDTCCINRHGQPQFASATT